MVMPSAQRCSQCGQAYMAGDCIQWPPTCPNCEKSEEDRALDRVVESINGHALARRVLELETDIRAGLKIAHELTPETQTVEEACAELVRLVRKAREERDKLAEVGEFGVNAVIRLAELAKVLPRCSWSGCNRIGTKWIARHVANCDEHGAEYLPDTSWAEYVRKGAK